MGKAKRRGPRFRWMPQTDAEMRAWYWGAKMLREGDEIVSYLAPSAMKPDGRLDEDEELAWDRLGPERFWRWATMGMMAEAESEMDIDKDIP